VPTFQMSGTVSIEPMDNPGVAVLAAAEEVQLWSLAALIVSAALFGYALAWAHVVRPSAANVRDGGQVLGAP
jgi:hypothetical protein